jgi:hypothetical protein
MIRRALARARNIAASLAGMDTSRADCDAWQRRCEAVEDRLQATERLADDMRRAQEGGDAHGGESDAPDLLDADAVPVLRGVYVGRGAALQAPASKVMHMHHHPQEQTAAQRDRWIEVAHARLLDAEKAQRERDDAVTETRRLRAECAGWEMTVRDRDAQLEQAIESIRRLVAESREQSEAVRAWLRDREDKAAWLAMLAAVGVKVEGASEQ